MKRDSMIFYASFHEAAKALESDTDRAALYDAIFEYALFGKEFELTGTPRAMFMLIKPQLDANIRKYKNGKRPKKKQTGSKPEAPTKQTGSKTEGNVNVNANVNHNDNANENEEKKTPPKKSPEKQTSINTKKENPNPSAGEKLVLWLEKECSNVQKMDSPITADEADRLVKDYRQRLQELKDVFISMDNHKGLKKKYVSANRTFRSWMNLRDKKAEESGNKQNPQTIKSLPSSAENNVEPKFKSAAMERIEQNQN